MKKKDLAKQVDRAVVIYARKSKITHKGDSIANQEEYCKEYARLHLQLPADYEFQIYEDEGKSGFYADRPDFQRMIRDVEQNRIRAIVCYKLDRISRKMSDLTAMIDYLNKHDVALLISSNNLNTQDSNSKMMIQMLGIIAEFERDIIKERITDNLIELAKDGRWMGGIPPTGFTVDRSKYGSGSRKNGYAYLITIPEKKKLIQCVFRAFLETRSYNAAAIRLNEEGLMYCPVCHRRLNVIPESNRFTHGKPRFKYACPNAVRKGPCDYQAVRAQVKALRSVRKPPAPIWRRTSMRWRRRSR